MKIDRRDSQLQPPELSSIWSCLLLIGVIVALPQRLPANDNANLIIAGQVIDRETKQPIKSFRVVPGVHFDQRRWLWDRRGSSAGINGNYRVRVSSAVSVHVVRAEANGYQPAVSRDIKSDEGSVSINFELMKGEDVEAVVLTPAGQPAGKAKVVVGIAGAAIAIRDGDIGYSNADWQAADGGGHFHFPPQLPGYYLVITHPSGYAKYQPGPHSNHRTIQLDPWTRVEGRLRVGGQPKANVPIWIWMNRTDTKSEDEVPYIATNLDTKTDPEGRFVFERVPAGKGQIGPHLMISGDKGAAEATSVRLIRAKFPLGKTVHVDLAGDGRRVVGKLVPAPGYGKAVSWNFAKIDLLPNGSQEIAPHPYFQATVGRDGSFHIDDVPAGGCALDVVFMKEPAGHLSLRFVVPALASGQPATPFDLGVLTLEKD